MRTRNEFMEMLNGLRLTNTAVEVGVAEGHFAAEFLAVWKGKRYILVDPWKRYGGYDDLIERDNVILEEIYQSVVKRFENEPRAQIMRGLSKEVAIITPNESLDFCYIDAWHKYEAVKEDIAHWWPKIRKGGILAGHDYSDTSFGVKRAVLEFVREYSLNLNVSELTPEEKTDQRSWWVIR